MLHSGRCGCSKWAARRHTPAAVAAAAASHHKIAARQRNPGSPAWQLDTLGSMQASRRRPPVAPAAAGAPGGNGAPVGQHDCTAAPPAASSQGLGEVAVARHSLETPTGWHHLDGPSIWKGTEEQAVFRQATPFPLSPTWKVILMSDGSVTRHLQLMTNQRVQVECLEQRNIGEERAGLPPAAAQIEGPLVQRQVLLHIPEPHSKSYVYATSWWSAATVDEYLKDRSQPIWVSLSQGRTELYRDILQLELGHSPYLEGRFQTAGPFWGRQYLFWHGGKPLTLIYEVFSSALEEFLGPQQQAEPPQQRDAR